MGLLEVLRGLLKLGADRDAEVARVQGENDKLQGENAALRVTIDQSPGLEQYSKTQAFRWRILRGYGFSATAWGLLCDIPLTIKDFGNTTGGGLTYQDHVELEGVQDEAAVHEFSHWVWERVGLPDTALVARYIEDYKRLAAGDGAPRAVDFANLQLYGDGQQWPGVLQLRDMDHALLSLASWHMGRFRDGPRALPPYLWPYFELLFTGGGSETPYYLR